MPSSADMASAVLPVWPCMNENRIIMLIEEVMLDAHHGTLRYTITG
tara:strand:- start:416 stop:553 length:138 start_codon:yes stop_codon:yes gene_type:complete